MSEQFITRLYKNSNLLDIAIQIEDFMDNLDIYVFENWIDGEIVDGPNVARYWVDMTILFPIDQMPDPEGGARLIKHGAEVVYKKAFRKEQVVKQRKESDLKTGPAARPEFEENEVWLVGIKVPRKFIEELDDDDLELYDRLMDIEDVSDARDENVDEENLSSEDDPMDGEEEL